MSQQLWNNISFEAVEFVREIEWRVRVSERTNNYGAQHDTAHRKEMRIFQFF